MDIENVDRIKFDLDMSDAIADMAEDCRNLMAQKAPKASGEYASGFVKKEHINKKDEVVWIVGNKNYRLPHLLENGHIVRNQHGGAKKGKRRVQPHPHMRPAYEQVVGNLDKYMSEVRVKVKE